MSDFSWPPLYEFPPFFTLQPNLTTRQKQIETWASLVLAYCQHNKVFTLDLVEAQQSPLFNNSKINRKLSSEGVGAVLDHLDKHGHIEWLEKQKRRCRILWRTTEQWAKLIYDWAHASGLLNSVCTLYELTSGEDTADEAFHGLDQDVLRKALRHLESEGRAQLLSVGSDEGVKFF